MNRAFTLLARSKIPQEGNLLSKNSRSQPHREGPAPISYRVLQVGHSNTKNLRSLFSSDYGDSPLNPRSLFSILKVGQGALWVRLSIRAQLGPEPLMSTLRQIEANRRNSEKSTGPTSVTGKAASSMNALKSGIHAKSLVLPSEKVADLEQLIDEYYQHHRPASPEARAFLDDLIRCEWTLRRLDTAESQMWQYQSDDRFRDPQKYPLGYAASCTPGTFTNLQSRVNPPRRARDRALLALERLKAGAQAAPVPDPVVEPALPTLVPPPPRPPPPTHSRPNGFLPPTPSATPRPPAHKSLTPNHFTPNWLRSANPLHHPDFPGATEPRPRPASARQYWVRSGSL